MQHLLKLGETSITTVGAAVLVVVLATIYYFIKNRNILPGPRGLPYVGLLPYLKDESVHFQLAKYAEKYGDCFIFNYCGQLFINIGSTKVLRELHVTKSDCFERMSAFNVFTTLLEDDGLFVMNGEAWKIQRKFFVAKFREYGMSSLKDSQSGLVNDCVETALKSLYKKQKEYVNIVQLLTEHSTALIQTILFGQNGITDHEIREVSAHWTASMESLFGTKLLTMGPFGRFLLGMSNFSQKSRKPMSVVRKHLTTAIERLEARMSEDSPTCIVEEYFKERNQRRKKGDPIWKTFTNEALVSTMAQFIGDGIAFMSSFISGILNGLIEHPEEAEKMYQEIMDVVGPSRQPTLDDKANLPYTTAFINESIRTSTILPMFTSMECTKEFSYRGYRIPKGAVTLYHFYSTHRNPDTYENPDSFNPSRFLAAPGKPKEDLPIIFGMGKRSCSGEAYVMALTYLYLTTIVKNFKIVSSNASKYMSTDFLVTGKLEMSFEPRPGVEI